MALLVLGLDTAGPVVGVASCQRQSDVNPWILLGTWSARVSRGAERLLLPSIECILSGRVPDLVAVASGPGTFTGLRVGMSTAMGLALGWNCPVVGVSALMARAALVPGQDRVLSLLDARKNRFYGAIFNTRADIPVCVLPEADLPLREFLSQPSDVAVGEGALVAAEQLKTAGIRSIPTPDLGPAPEVARIGALLAESGAALSPDRLEARYIRPPDARRPQQRRP